MHTHSTRTTTELLELIVAQERRIESLIWNDELSMYNQAGIRDAISRLIPGTYTVIFCDINRLKQINSVTQSHVQTNRYLRDGMRVRHGEIAGQLYGDEFLFVLPAHADAAAFCTRITRQLAQQPLSQSERSALEMIDGLGARLSATFAYEQTEDIRRSIERLSADVLAQKAKRNTS